MIIYTIGFTQKTAEEFFEPIKINKVKTLIDIRLHNNSQIAGFAKGEHLPYLLREICKCKYEYCPIYAPSESLLKNYREEKISWKDYEVEYKKLMRERNALTNFVWSFGNHKSVCLLCSELTHEQCHRRLLAEMIAELEPETEIIHL